MTRDKLKIKTYRHRGCGYEIRIIINFITANIKIIY